MPVLFALILILSFFVAYLGRNRHMGFWGYFFASVLLTPLIGALLVIVSRKNDAEEDGDQ